MDSTRAQIFQLFIRRFSLLALACILLLSIYLLEERRELLEHTKQRETALINNASRDADYVMRRVLRDLLYLSKEIESGLSSRPGSSMTLAETTRKFITFSEIKSYFDQVRFLDMSGMEVIRINHSQSGVEVVPKAKLQNKGDRYYFKDAVSLKKGEVYISPLDLNIEGKEIEVPYKPMIRLATPVMDGNGKKAGVLVLNYLASELLSRINENTPTVPKPTISLLNSDGYWLLSPDPEKSWGFMLKKPDLVYSKQFPVVWQQISSQESGQLYDSTGLHTFRNIYPLHNLISNDDKSKVKKFSIKLPPGYNYHWVLVSHIERHKVVSSFMRKCIVMTTGLALFLSVSGIFMWIYIRNRFEQDGIKRERDSVLSQYKHLFDHMTTGFALHEIICNDQGEPIDYRFLEVNPAFERMTGLKGADIIGRTVLELMPDTEEHWIKQYGKVALTNEADQFENFSAALNKHFKVAVFSPSHGQFACIISDITERKRAEEVLRESEERFDQLAVQTRTFHWEVNTEGRYIYVSHVVKDVLGYDPEELIGRLHFYDIHPENGREDFKASAFKAFDKKEQFYDLLNPVQCKSGDIRWVSTSGLPMLNPDGTLQGYRGSDTDISERRHLEEQLRQSQKMEVVGQLAGGVAHDFNNILTVISGYSGLLQADTSLAKEHREYVSEIAEAANKASQLTHGLLAFSRKQTLLMKHEDLNDIIQHVQKFMARIIGEDIALLTAYSTQDLQVYADKGQIEQVLINLASNARDAMPNGGTFSIKSELVHVDSTFNENRENELSQGSYALLTVSDTGKGIPKEYLKHIFEPFFTTKEVGKGTGLGMAIIYGIIKQHNGIIDVDSELDLGTTFKIYLPIRSAGDKQSSEKIDSSVPESGSETILVAEDDPTVRTLVEKIFKGHGYDTILAENGQDAIEKFIANQDKINLIFMDVIMPKKNGTEAYDEIQRIRPDIKVLFTSGYTSDFIEKRGVSEENIELIMKPVKPAELLQKIREMLDAP